MRSDTHTHEIISPPTFGRDDDGPDNGVNRLGGGGGGAAAAGAGGGGAGGGVRGRSGSWSGGSWSRKASPLGTRGGSGSSGGSRDGASGRSEDGETTDASRLVKAPQQQQQQQSHRRSSPFRRLSSASVSSPSDQHQHRPAASPRRLSLLPSRSRKNSAASSVHVPADLPPIVDTTHPASSSTTTTAGSGTAAVDGVGVGGGGDGNAEQAKADREAQWERRATLLAQHGLAQHAGRPSSSSSSRPSTPLSVNAVVAQTAALNMGMAAGGAAGTAVPAVGGSVAALGGGAQAAGGEGGGGTTGAVMADSQVEVRFTLSILPLSPPFSLSTAFLPSHSLSLSHLFFSLSLLLPYLFLLSQVFSCPFLLERACAIDALVNPINRRPLPRLFDYMKPVVSRLK